jgi:hypothetical protein
VDAPGKDGNASMPEQVKRPNSWRKMMIMMIRNFITTIAYKMPTRFSTCCATAYSWLRHCATSGRVAGSILDGVIKIFHRLNPGPGVD